MLSALLLVASFSAGAGYAGSGKSFWCLWDWQCGGECINNWCKNADNGVRCAFDGDCRSGHCGWDLKCGPELNENDWCDSDIKCKSGFCHKEWKNFGIYDLIENRPKEGKMGRPSTQLSKKIVPWDPVCRTKKDNYQHVGINMAGNSNVGECKSGHATCGWCTPKGKSYTNDVGQWCTKEEHCKWNLICLPDENNYHIGCRGSCGTKKEDGEFLGIDGNHGKKVVLYSKYCKSGRGVCGTCSSTAVQPEGAACGETSDCGPRLYCELMEKKSWWEEDYMRDHCKGVCREQFDANAVCVNWKGEDDACKDHQRTCKVDPKAQNRRTCQLRVTPQPTPSPTPKPTPAPVTQRPTFEPTPAPTPSPTGAPTEEPSADPTHAPSHTLSPTVAPTAEPTPIPTLVPFDAPTTEPSQPAPIETPLPTSSPSTENPTASPIGAPTETLPTFAPTEGPTPVGIISPEAPARGPTTVEPSKPVASRQEKNGSAKGVFSSQIFIAILILMCLVIVIIPLICHYVRIPRMCGGGDEDVKDGVVDVKDGGVILI